MATLNTLGVDSLSLRGSGDEYNRLSRFFRTRAEAEAALGDGSWTPVAGVLNACVTGDEGVLVYSSAGQTLDNADQATRTYISEQIANLVGDAPALLDQLSELADAMNDNPDFITNLSIDLTNETTARETADTNLQSEIDAETTARSAADTTLQTNIDSVNSDLSAEQATRADADTALNTAIGITGGDTDLGSFAGSTIGDGLTVKAALQQLETTLEAVDIDTDDLAALTGIAENVTDLGTFTGSTIQDNVAVKVALQDLETSVEAEATRATAAETALQADVDQNESDADAADAALGLRIDAVEAEIDTARTNIYTALGQTEGATEMGTFTGSTLSDNTTVHALLQELETATETEISDRQAAIADILDGATFTGDILFGSLARLRESGNEFKIQNDAQSSSIVLGPKISLQPATGSRIELFETVRMPDGTDLTVTGAELNFVDGVTSNIQTQLDAIQADVDQNESDSDAAIAVERGRIDAILDASDADKDSFAEIVTLINSVDTANDNAFAAYVLSNDAAVAAVQADVDQNEADSDAAIALKADIADPTFTGTVTIPTLDVNTTITTPDIRVDAGGDNATLTFVLETDGGADAGGLVWTRSSGGADIGAIAYHRSLDAIRFYTNGNTNYDVEIGSSGELNAQNGLAIGGTSLTATAAELNALDGITATVTELNYVDGVTSAIQDQLDAIQADVNQNESDADAAIAANEVHVDNLVSLSGVAKDQVHLSTFTGSTIVDNRTVKAALQDLETALETTQADVDQNESDADAAIAAVLAGTSIPGPYNNDSDAATGGVAVGAIYKNSNGTIHWRVS